MKVVVEQLFHYIECSHLDSESTGKKKERHYRARCSISGQMIGVSIMPSHEFSTATGRLDAKTPFKIER
jgi:hypothetical protein